MLIGAEKLKNHVHIFFVERSVIRPDINGPTVYFDFSNIDCDLTGLQYISISVILTTIQQAYRVKGAQKKQQSLLFFILPPKRKQQRKTLKNQLF